MEVISRDFEEDIQTEEVSKSVELESPLDFKRRKRSHYVIYTTTFIMSIGFSIILTSIWPYLQQVSKILINYSYIQNN